MMYSKAKADKQGKNKELDEVIDDLNKYKDEAEAYAKERGVEIDDDRLDDLINTIKKGGTKASQYRMICRYNAE